MVYLGLFGDVHKGNSTWNLKAFDEFQSLIIFASRVESRFSFQKTEFVKSRQTTNISPSDSHKPKLYLELKVIVEHREISIGDSILDFVSFSFSAFFRKTSPSIESSLNPPKIYESNFLVMNKRVGSPRGCATAFVHEFLDFLSKENTRISPPSLKSRLIIFI